MPTDNVAFRSPTTVEEALVELEGGEATVIAGGTSVALLIGQGLLEPMKLVSLARISSLGAIDVDPEGGHVTLGAGVTMRQVAKDQRIRAAFPALSTAAGVVGNPRVRSVATVGGAVAHADPRQDLPPALMALGAQVIVRNTAGVRTLPLQQFVTGFMETELGPDELVTAVTFPLLAGQRSHYARFTPGSCADYPTVGVAASLRLDDENMIREAAVALGGVDMTAIAADSAPLVGRHATDTDAAVAAVAAQAAQVCSPSDDRRGSAEYKRAMVRVWTERAIVACLGP